MRKGVGHELWALVLCREDPRSFVVLTDLPSIEFVLELPFVALALSFNHALCLDAIPSLIKPHLHHTHSLSHSRPSHFHLFTGSPSDC